MLGAAFQKTLSIGAVIMGWGIAEVAIMVNTVAVCGCLSLCALVMIALNYHVSDAYCNDCFPKRQVCGHYCRKGLLIVSEQGEISALVNLARTLGGFSVAYFQVPWATKHGALQTFGVEAACAIPAHFRSRMVTDNL